MVKVITYGTYDLLHHGHIRLLERAKALGDYLIVGVTSDGFDKARGKINVQQSLLERIDAVRQTGLADEIIVEEYEGQKIDDIRNLGIDIFTVGSDWVGKFDYLKEFCKVVYLDRTSGISSSEIRTEKNQIRIGFVGETNIVNKYIKECFYVDGVSVSGIYTLDKSIFPDSAGFSFFETYSDLLDNSDVVCIVSHPNKHFEQIETALKKGKHVLCESPVATREDECKYLFQLARDNSCILSEAIKTAYSTAYQRLLLLVKSGIIGDVMAIDATCTSMRFDSYDPNKYDIIWSSMCAWGPTAMLPIFQLLGTNYLNKIIYSHVLDSNLQFDLFSKIDFLYQNVVASIKIGEGVKSENSLIVSGSKGYIYVPSPWWKTDYFEVRYENQENNKRYFYQLDGEGIRYEIMAFLNAIKIKSDIRLIKQDISIAISKVIEDFRNHKDTILI